MTFPPGPPERMRALVLEVFYDDLDRPSVSVPCLDFFGLPHGRPVAYHSAVMAVNEGRGFNTTLPLPFRGRIRIELMNAGEQRALFYYQVDYCATAYVYCRDAQPIAPVDVAAALADIGRKPYEGPSRNEGLSDFT